METFFIRLLLVLALVGLSVGVYNGKLYLMPMTMGIALILGIIEIKSWIERRGEREFIRDMQARNKAKGA